MTIRRCLVFALLAGFVGAFVGRAVRRDALGAQAAPSASSAPLAATTHDESCKPERAALASTRVKLAMCIARGTWALDAEPSSAPERAEPDLPADAFDPRGASRVEEIRRNRALFDDYPEAVIVQHHDGTTGVYKPDEWPDDGDGVIIARKLPGGRIGFYAGPEAGPRSDPAAFRPSEPAQVPATRWEVEPDGTITIDGRPAPPEVQRMFGGKVDDPSRRSQ